MLLARRKEPGGSDEGRGVFRLGAGFCGCGRGKITGFCTLAKGCLPDVPYTPYIGFVFVGGPYRGNRLSQKLIEAALRYAKTIPFEWVYLVSVHKGLYEKYGFVKADEKPVPRNPGVMESVYMSLT